MTGDKITAFIRKEARANIRNNIILNSLFTYLGNRGMSPTVLEGGGVATDTVSTCIFMSLIMTLFTSMAVKKALASGELLAHDLALPENSPLRMLPIKPWLLGLCMGPMMAVAFMPWVVGFCHLIGLHTLSFWQVLAVKAFYTFCITIIVIKWVVLRLLNYYANQREA